MKVGHTSRNLVNVCGFFFCRQDVSISIFGHTKEFSENRSTSLMCNFGVRSRFWDIIYRVRPHYGSPVVVKKFKCQIFMVNTVLTNHLK